MHDGIGRVPLNTQRVSLVRTGLCYPHHGEGMPNYTPDLDNGDLADWRKVVENELRWNGVLIGNGSSRAVWSGFSYPSLYDRACSGDVADPLLAEDVALFDAFE